MPTHQVTNQVPPLVDVNAIDSPVIADTLRRSRIDAVSIEEIRVLGKLGGSAEALALGDYAEAHPPVLNTHDRYGNRVDEVVYTPAYHQLMEHAVRHGLHAAPWADPRTNAHLIRALKFSVWGHVDAGHGCPISMTYSVIPALRTSPELASRYEPLLCAKHYDPGLREPMSKRGLLAGMSMTEKQGGSDVRANTTDAMPRSDGTYRITGHKWFTSAPMSDIFLVLAQAPDGLSCFLIPRVLPDGTRNTFNLQRLKDKLGNRSNASSEVEYDDTIGWLIGEEGKGVKTIVEMVNLTRLDCVLGTATAMRTAVTHAAHHTAHRSAFGALLSEQPLMKNVLADLAVEAEAATTAALWLAELTDRSVSGDEHSALLRRIALAVTKYHVCKRGPIHAAEALECLGGNGYVEESRMPRIYREVPLMSIWEGSGNVAALDVLRALARQPETLGVFLDEVKSTAGTNRHLDNAVARLEKNLTAVDPANQNSMQYNARRIVGDMAAVLQGSLLLRYGHPVVADTFAITRLARDWGDAFGTLPDGIDTRTLIDRAIPKTGAHR